MQQRRDLFQNVFGIFLKKLEAGTNIVLTMIGVIRQVIGMVVSLELTHYLIIDGMLHWYEHKMALFVVIVYSIIKYGAFLIKPALFNCCIYI